jgi:hypothetical protein
MDAASQSSEIDGDLIESARHSTKGIAFAMEGR